MIKSSKLHQVYNDFITKGFDYKDIEKGTIRIDTPFFDRHNDSLILYALANSDNSLTLTDGGYILDDLEASGVYIMRSPQRRQILKTQLLSYGVSLNKTTNELFIQTTATDFPNDKHRLLQAMLFTNDMFLLGNKTNASVFFEDVASFLDNHNIRAMRNVSFTGLSGMSHKFEFSIAGIQNIPDKLIKTLNVPNNEMYAKALTADVHNTSEVLTRPTKFYAFINDTEREMKPDIISLLEHEQITVVPFSNREKFAKELAM